MASLHLHLYFVNVRDKESEQTEQIPKHSSEILHSSNANVNNR